MVNVLPWGYTFLALQALKKVAAQGCLLKIAWNPTCPLAPSEAVGRGPTEFMTPPETAGTVIGRYHLLQKIGEGGMGEVWLAEQKEAVRRRVALQLIRSRMNTWEVIARFESERQALALMDHPAIAKAFDAHAPLRLTLRFPLGHCAISEE
jgi:hypothetical protein